MPHEAKTAAETLIRHANAGPDDPVLQRFFAMTAPTSEVRLAFEAVREQVARDGRPDDDTFLRLVVALVPYFDRDLLETDVRAHLAGATARRAVGGGGGGRRRVDHRLDGGGGCRVHAGDGNAGVRRRAGGTAAGRSPAGGPSCAAGPRRARGSRAFPGRPPARPRTAVRRAQPRRPGLRTSVGLGGRVPARSAHRRRRRRGGVDPRAGLPRPRAHRQPGAGAARPGATATPIRCGSPSTPGARACTGCA